MSSNEFGARARFSWRARSQLASGGVSAVAKVARAALLRAGTAFVRVAIYGFQGNNDYASTYDYDDVTLVVQ